MIAALVTLMTLRTMCGEACFPQTPNASNEETLAVTISTERGDNVSYTIGERLVFLISVNKPAWLYLYYLEVDGTVLPIWPEEKSSKGSKGIARPIGTMRIPEDFGRSTFLIDGPQGIETVLAIASTRRLTRSTTLWPLDEWPEDRTPLAMPRGLTPAELSPPERAMARIEYRVEGYERAQTIP